MQNFARFGRMVTLYSKFGDEMTFANFYLRVRENSSFSGMGATLITLIGCNTGGL